MGWREGGKGGDWQERKVPYRSHFSKIRKYGRVFLGKLLTFIRN
jgi:hypothetical protein